MKLKQKTETRVSENTNRESNVSKKNTSLSLFGATIITVFLALLVVNCPGSSTNTTTTGTFAFVCDNGIPTAGMTAPTTTTNSCGSCDSGYSLSAGVDSDCVASAPGTFAFVCENGTPTASMTAPTAMTNSCKGCDSGYSLSAGVDSDCVASAPGTFAFVCENGAPTAGMTAPTATTNSCGSCDSGFELSGQVGSNCVASAPGTFAFVCSNGMPTDGMTAPTATTNSCKGCDSGFMLSGGAGSNCVASAPTFAFVCSNGMPTDGMTAPTATTNSCKGCDSGYSLSAGVDSNCIANRATTSDLLITQFQSGRGDSTTTPMTEFRQTISESYGTSANGCRNSDGTGGATCRSSVIEIFNASSSAVTLSDYALIYSLDNSGWGMGGGSCQETDQTGVQIRFNGSIESPLYDITNAHCRRLVLADSLNSNTELAPGSFHVVSIEEFNGINFIPHQLWVEFSSYGGNDGVALARLASSYTPANCPTGTEAANLTFDGSTENWCILDKFGDVWSTNPGISWQVTSSSTDTSRRNTFLRKRSVTAAPTANWSTSRGCTAGCDTASPTIGDTTQWLEVSGYVYTNVGIDTLPSN